MTKSKYARYRCSECGTPCNLFFELEKGTKPSDYEDVVECVTGLCGAKWKFVKSRFTPNGI